MDVKGRVVQRSMGEAHLFSRIGAVIQADVHAVLHTARGEYFNIAGFFLGRKDIGTVCRRIAAHVARQVQDGVCS